jgi:hypothetical protein
MQRPVVIAAFAALLVPAVAAAQSPAPSSADERRLTPEQIEKVLADAAAKREGSARPQMEPDDQPPPIFGELGVTVGTGGYREGYGTVVYPFDEGAAAFSFDYLDWGRAPRPPRY